MFWNLGWLGRQQPWNSAVVLVGRISWKGCFSCWCILALFVFCDTRVLFLIASLVNWCSLEWNSVDSSCSVNKSYNTCPNTIPIKVGFQQCWSFLSVIMILLQEYYLHCTNRCHQLPWVFEQFVYGKLFVSCLVCIAYCADILIVGVITLWWWLGVRLKYRFSGRTLTW